MTRLAKRRGLRLCSGAVILPTASLRKISILLVTSCLLGGLSVVPEARAHTKSISYSSWVLGAEGASVRTRISLLELSRLGVVVNGVADPAQVSDYLAGRLQLFSGGHRCEATSAPSSVSAPEGWVIFEWRTSCAASGDQVIESSILLDVAPSHIHFARVHEEGVPTRERVLSAREPSWRVEQDEAGATGGGPEGTSIVGYLRIGVEHILSGWDHLAFVFALLLLAGSVGEVARLVTGFTLAHSVTLALAVLGVLNPEPAPIEALIGFSIALVAAENTWLLSGKGWSIPACVVIGVASMTVSSFFGVGLVSWSTLFGLALFAGCHFGLLTKVRDPQNLRVAVAFAFGLIHGFGFAGVLSEMSLPTERLAAALFGFNVGVELGQLAVVAIVWPLLYGLARMRDGRAHAWVTELGSAAVCGLGLFWFVTRSFA